jgi:subfamily B ATP-binding cassette protein MsbA
VRVASSKPFISTFVRNLINTFRPILRLAGRVLPAWSSKTPVSRLIRQTAKSQKWILLGNLGFTLLLGVAEAGLFTVLYQVIRVLSGGPLPQLLQSWQWSRGQAYVFLLLAVLLLQLIASLSRAISGVLSGTFSSRCQASIIPAIHNYILSLSYNCSSDFKVGELAYRASLAPQAIATEIEQGSQIMSDSLLGMIYLIALLLISPWLLLLASILAFSMGWTQKWLRPRISKEARDVAKHQQQIAGLMTSDFQVLRLLHSSAAIQQASQIFVHRLQGLEPKLRKLSTLRSMIEPIGEMMPMIAAVLLGLISWRLNQGQTDLLIPGLATFVLALQRLNLRLIKLGQNINVLSENQGRLEVLNRLLDTSGKEFRPVGGLHFEGLTNQICFENVWLNYPNRPIPALQGISFRIPKNSTVALVGSSGAGKSTITDLLVGLINPNQGRILIDGHDLKSLDLDSWQQHLGVVSQDILLINDTISNNIAFGMGRVSEHEIRQAAVKAFADDYIRNLPQGYDTVVGEQGQRLSGGQRQRLSLARAILRQPEILILDEATSALDSETEAKVQQAVESFGNNRTVLAVAHRLSSICNADQIIVLGSGSILESGSHDDLLARGGRYAELWDRQQRGIIDDLS